MPGIAPHVGWYGRRWPKPLPAPFAARDSGASQPGTTILTQQFGSDLRIAVEVAWGGTYANQAAWSWSDITDDVRLDPGITITQGSADETTTPQPAQCAFTLDNRSGAYSQGGQSPNYPNVKRGLPVRVLAIYHDSVMVRFQGYLVGATPEWDVTGSDAVVHVIAAGNKRRLLQQTAPIGSVLRRTVPALGDAVAYWPCEDGSASSQLVSGLAGQPAMTIVGTSNLASFSGFAATDPIPTFKTDSWFGDIPTYLDPNTSCSITFLINTPTAGLPDQTVIFSMNTSGGSGAHIEFRYDGTPSAGAVRMLVYRYDGVVLYDSSSGFALTSGLNRVIVQWTTSGGNTTFRYSRYAILATTEGAVTSSPIACTMGIASNITFAPNADMQGVSIGQVFIENSYVDPLATISQVNGYAGEIMGTRINRLCAEQGETLARSGLTTETMGAQLSDSFINLMEGAAALEGGKLCDGFGPGLTYFARTNKTNRGAIDMGLDASAGHIEHPIGLVDDDQLTVNSYTASRVNGSSATYTDTSGVMGTVAIGEYNGSASLNVATDGQLADIAAWAVHMGATQWVGTTYRMPTISLAFHHHPELYPAWHGMQIFAQMAIYNLDSVRPQLSHAPLYLLLEGYTEVISQFTWSVTANCSRADLWSIGVLSAGVGDTPQYVQRIESLGTTVATGCAAGGSSITVSVTGPAWTTNSDDFPFTIEVSGNLATVTSISGSTFTLDPTTVIYPIRAGDSVTLGGLSVTYINLASSI